MYCSNIIPNGITQSIYDLIDSTRLLLNEIDIYQEIPEGEVKTITVRILRKRFGCTAKPN